MRSIDGHAGFLPPTEFSLRFLGCQTLLWQADAAKPGGPGADSKGPAA